MRVISLAERANAEAPSRGAQPGRQGVALRR
jgi:hypothetical protein